MTTHSGAGSSIAASFASNSTKSPYDVLSERFIGRATQSTQSSGSQYVYRTQSEFFCTDVNRYEAEHLNRLLSSDVHQRVTYVGENISSHLFPDKAFGFVLNVDFQEAFIDTFLASNATFDMKNFTSGEVKCANFLNQMISTVASFIQATGEPSLKDFHPRRYFVPCQDTPVKGSTILRKPDLMLVRLIDDCTRGKSLTWIDVQSLAETTRENLPPMRMKETMFTKNYLTFCSQPERDFLINLSFTGSGFFISVIDHSGTMETNPISFQLQPNTLIFLRMVLGLAFLPDEYLGVDTTMTCRETGVSSGKKFKTEFPPLRHDFPNASVIAFPTLSKVTPTPLPTPSTAETDNPRIISISVGQTAYRVISVLFEARTLIGRATRAYLVELPDGKFGVLKDSWIVMSMRSEAEVLGGYCIPFCPEIIRHSVLRNTSSLRVSPHKSAEIIEYREKRRVVVYPAGVHIADFSCLWELMAAFMDVVIGIMCLESKQTIHRDISYTNILLRTPGPDSQEKQEWRAQITDTFDLSGIENLRKQYSCREGLLIDFDYATRLAPSESIEESGDTTSNAGSKGDGSSATSQPVQLSDADEDNCQRVSGVRTGTPPFIAIELLLFGVSHRVVHDLESVFYVLLFICTHLSGPHNTISDPPLFGNLGKDVHASPMKLWLQQTNFLTLGGLKYNHMPGMFEELILPHISHYFKPLRQHLVAFWRALHPQITHDMLPRGRQGIHSQAEPEHILHVLKTALNDPALIGELKTGPSSLGKRSAPGELISAPNGWDAIEIPKKILRDPPHMQSKPARKVLLAGKQRKQRRG